MDERFHQYKTLLFQPLEIREASEPTDIIWENRFYLPIERFYKKCIVFFVIIVMLFFSFQIIFNLQKKSLAMKGRYPSQNCADYNEDYHKRREKWKDDAIDEYLAKNKLIEQGEQQVYFTGPF